MTQTNARYSICTIVTKDINLLKRSNTVRSTGKTHEDIYVRGLEEIEQDSIDNMKQNNTS